MDPTKMNLDQEVVSPAESRTFKMAVAGIRGTRGNTATTIRTSFITTTTGLRTKLPGQGIIIL